MAGIVLGFIGEFTELNELIVFSVLAIAMVIPCFPVIWIGLVKSKQSLKEFLSLKFKVELIWPALILFLGLPVVISGVYNFIMWFFDLNTDLYGLIGLQRVNILLVWTVICFIMPVLEEIIFRGIILNGLLRHYRVGTAIFMSAIIFSVVHLNIPQGITALITGLVFGWIYYRTKYFLLPVIGHIIVNSMAILGSRYTEIDGFSNFKGSFQPLWLTLSGVLLTIAGFYLVHTNVNRFENMNKLNDNKEYVKDHSSL